MEQWFDFQNEILEQLQNDEMEKSARVRLNHQGEQETGQNDLRRRQAPTSSATPVYSAIPTFVPPPKQDITPELLNESLSNQPQNTATISSIIPYFRDNVLQINMQLMGLVADTLVVNASASLACAGIGLDPEPKIAVVPKVVQQGQGQPQIQVADCQCIGVNMYTPNVITYWIQKVSDGTIYSLIGSNTVIDIDKMNTTQSTSLSIVTLPVGSTKRRQQRPWSMCNQRDAKSSAFNATAFVHFTICMSSRAPMATAGAFSMAQTKRWTFLRGALWHLISTPQP
jgi:hypothetical protein